MPSYERHIKNINQLLIDVILKFTFLNFKNFKIFTGMLFGPDDLWESNDDIIKEISFFSVGVKKNVFVFVCTG